MKQHGNLTVERHQPPGTTTIVYRLGGKLIGTQECYEFLEAVRGDVHAGQSDVVFELAGLERITSPGIGVLAAIYTSISNAGGRMSVAAASPQVQDLLKLVCFWDLLEHFPTEAEALRARAS
jgi:anti-anti-sigma factor